MIKNMNSKVTTNSQLSATKPKKTQKQTKQTTRTETESQKWTSHGGLSAGKGRELMGEKVQGISSINGRYKIGNIEAKELGPKEAHTKAHHNYITQK